MQNLTILAISGSLRAHSTNTELLIALATLAPAGVSIDLYDGLDRLPHFNPDLEPTEPAPVIALKRRVAGADGLIISSPEYARGVPGSLKNALDWLVASVELPHKPVALLNASPWATHAQASLMETLTVMTTRIVHEACATIPVTRGDLAADGTIASTEIRAALRAALDVFARDIATRGVNAS